MGDGRASHTLSPSAANLDTWSHRVWTDGLQLDTLPELECLTIRTRNSVYEITVTTPGTGEILIRGGQFFPVLTSVVLAGASLGSSFLKRRGIYVGFHMELHHAGQRFVTTRIRSILRTSCGRVQ